MVTNFFAAKNSQRNPFRALEIRFSCAKPHRTGYKMLFPRSREPFMRFCWVVFAFNEKIPRTPARSYISPITTINKEYFTGLRAGTTASLLRHWRVSLQENVTAKLSNVPRKIRWITRNFSDARNTQLTYDIFVDLSTCENFEKYF